jgi:hypothetical protein
VRVRTPGFPRPPGRFRSSAPRTTRIHGQYRCRGRRHPPPIRKDCGSSMPRRSGTACRACLDPCCVRDWGRGNRLLRAAQGWPEPGADGWGEKFGAHRGIGGGGRKIRLSKVNGTATDGRPGGGETVLSAPKDACYAGQPDGTDHFVRTPGEMQPGGRPTSGGWRRAFGAGVWPPGGGTEAKRGCRLSGSGPGGMSREGWSEVGRSCRSPALAPRRGVRGVFPTFLESVYRSFPVGTLSNGPRSFQP